MSRPPITVFELFTEDDAQRWAEENAGHLFVIPLPASTPQKFMVEVSASLRELQEQVVAHERHYHYRSYY